MNKPEFNSGFSFWHEVYNMSGQYFSNNPDLKHDLQSYKIEINGQEYRFLTDAGVFSKKYLDFGTKTLLSVLEVSADAKTLLDLGCGYGPIGIVMKRRYEHLLVTLSDVNERAVRLAAKNLLINEVDGNTIVSDGFDNLSNTFDVITLNPPIRAGKEKVYELYDGAYDHLNKDGKLWVVIQKKQGAESTINHLNKLFNNCNVILKNKGYYILVSQK